MAIFSAYVSKVFGRSPFSDLQAHAGLCIAAAEELLVLFPAAHQADWDKVEQSYDRLTELENQADAHKRKIRSNLPRGFFLPVARADLLDLLGRQDEIANGARDIAGLVLGRKLQFPVSLQPTILQLVERSIDTCRQTGEIIDTLDELIDTTFRGPQARRVIDMIGAVETIEHQTDQLVVQIRADLFALEDSLPPIQVMFLYRSLDRISELADVAERVAHRVQMMLAQ